MSKYKAQPKEGEIMSKDEFVTLVSDRVEEFFPKGKTKMRGEAMALVAMIAADLIKAGVLSEHPTPRKD